VHVESLWLTQFRSYRNLEVEFDPQLNFFIGSNAQGKTNILEAVHCLSTARSLRGATDEEMIQFEREEAAVEAKVVREEGPETLRLEFRLKKPKTLYINGKKEKKLSALLGRLPAVVFSPDDLFLIKGGALLRRRYLDMTILQMDRGYLAHLQAYERALKQRNALLRQKGTGLESQLLVWELPLSQHGSALMQRRRDLTRLLGDFAESALRDLTGGMEKFEVLYEPQLDGGEDGEDLAKRLLEALQKSRREDMARLATGVGPHRDDLVLFVNGKSLRRFGSQGQQRTGALALKLAQLSILAEGCQREPLILFDDVMAELDEKRRAYFLNKIQGGGQAFLTGTSRADFLGAGTRARVFKVEEGRVESLS